MSPSSPVTRRPGPVARRWSLLAVAGLVSTALVVGPTATAAPPVTPGPAAGAVPVTDGVDPRAGRLSAAASDPGEYGRLLAVDDGARVLLDTRERPVAPGIALDSFDYIAREGFIRGQALTVELGDRRVTPDYLSSGAVTRPEPLQTTAERTGAVAAINGDFFDINNSFAALGAGQRRDGTLVKGPVPGHQNVVGFDAAGLGRISRALFEGTITVTGPDGQGGETLPLAGYNQHQVEADGIGAFTSGWGEASRARLTEGATSVREVTVTDGVVTAVADVAGSGAIAEDVTVLVGRDLGATRLSTLALGDRVSLTTELRFTGEQLRTTLGANQPLVVDGEVVTYADPAAHPRMAIGFDATGTTAFLVSIDGRIAESRGMTLTELGHYMAERGAVNAINLDGGGSATLLAREAGEDDLDLENTPSDGSQRPVPNGLGLYAAEGTGRLTGLRLVPAAEEEDDDLRAVFPGLSRPLAALGHDETLAPVAADPLWRVRPVPGSTGGATGTIRGDGVFVAGPRPGAVTVRAEQRGVTGAVELEVLGRLDRIRADVDSVVVPDRDAVGRFGLTGIDADGFSAPIDPRDVTLDYDTTRLRIEAAPDGRFTVTPLVERAGVVVTATVGSATTRLGVAVGLDQQVIADFDDTADWTFGTARASGSITPVEGREGGTALQLDYDFTTSTATRTAYANAPIPIAVDGRPQSIGAWIKGEGRGEWTAFTVIDADGASHPLYGPYVTWTGWQYVEVPIPATVSVPIRAARFTAIETKAGASYRGRMVIDDLTVTVAPSVEVPAAPRVVDDVIIRDGQLGTDGRRWRFAVVSDAQFTAANPALLPQARRTLREAVAADPDFVVINGDLIDTAYPADLELARRLIDEELEGKVPWYYVPGNHEITGPGTVAPWSEEFGPAYRSFTHEGTRFVLLDSTTGTLTGGGYEQWQLLDRALREARADDEVTGVVVMAHHPPRDPSPVKLSQLSNAYEVAVVEDLLADFTDETGKGAAYGAGHGGAFSATPLDGVSYVINGNAGKAPSTTPAEGGFTGWTLVGVDPDGRAADGDWLRVQTRPHVDGLTLGVPATLRVGERGAARAALTQGARTFPVDYPMSTDWGGTRVHVGSGTPASTAVVRLDAATGTLTALRPGSATVSVTVNGVTREANVSVTR